MFGPLLFLNISSNRLEISMCSICCSYIEFILQGRSKDFIQKNYVHILALLSQLRQACNHPFLLKGKECAHSVGLAKQLPVVTAVNLLKVLESGAAKCTICGVSKQFIQNLCKQFLSP